LVGRAVLALNVLGYLRHVDAWAQAEAAALLQPLLAGEGGEGVRRLEVGRLIVKRGTCCGQIALGLSHPLKGGC
jgi:hypothetical protein